MRTVLVPMFLFTASLAAFAGEEAPPIGDFSIDVGAKYAYFKNKMRFETQFNGYQGISGYTGATIALSNVVSKGAEVSAVLIHNPSRMFANLSVMGGWISEKSGSARDTDFISSSGVTILDALSSVKIDKNYAGHIDIGRRYFVGGINLSPAMGYYYANLKMHAYGLTNLPVGNYTVYNNMGLSVGSAIPNNVNIGDEQSIVHAPRLSVGISKTLTDSITVIIEPAYMPLARITFNDWHKLQLNKVQDGAPNLISKSSGWGYSLDADLSYRFSQTLNFTAGLKYSRFSMGQADALDRMVTGNSIQTNGTKSVSFETLGFLFGAKYRF